MGSPVVPSSSFLMHYGSFISHSWCRVSQEFFATKATGTGLGLAIVQQIIKAHAGVLQIESSALDGTTVTVTLPAHTYTPELYL